MKTANLILLLIGFPLLGCSREPIKSDRCYVLSFQAMKEVTEARAALVAFAENNQLLADFAFGDTINVYAESGKARQFRIKLGLRPEQKAELTFFLYEKNPKERARYEKKFDDFYLSAIAGKFNSRACADVPEFDPSVEYRN